MALWLRERMRHYGTVNSSFPATTTPDDPSLVQPPANAFQDLHARLPGGLSGLAIAPDGSAFAVGSVVNNRAIAGAVYG